MSKEANSSPSGNLEIERFQNKTSSNPEDKWACFTVKLLDQTVYQYKNQSKLINTEEATISDQNDNDYDQKMLSLKPGQKLSKRPNLDIRQMLKNTTRLSK
jgi:hypothetical protein